MLKYTSNEKSLTQFETSTWQTSRGSPGVSRLPKQTKLYIKGLLIFFNDLYILKDVSENQNAQNYLSDVHLVNRSLILNFADFFDTWTDRNQILPKIVQISAHRKQEKLL